MEDRAVQGEHRERERRRQTKKKKREKFVRKREETVGDDADVC